MIYNRWYIPYHLVIVTGTLLFNLFLGGCPLTWWEERHRKAWDPSVYYHPNSFAVTYFKRILNVNLNPRQVNWILLLIKVTSFYVAAVLITLRNYIK